MKREDQDLWVRTVTAAFEVGRATERQTQHAQALRDCLTSEMLSGHHSISESYDRLLEDVAS
jgi:hypothetical protein